MKTPGEAHVDFDEKLTKAEASRRIDELQQQTGRGRTARRAARSARRRRTPRQDARHDDVGRLGSDG